MATNRKAYSLKPRTLTYEQVQAIMYEMGHEPDAATVFWRLVTKGVGAHENAGQ